jgi:fermentation-respiration switch protein FrsA (DUF1100 family)
MTLVKSVLICGLVAYIAIATLMYVVQRSLMYFPDTARTPPSHLGFDAEEITLRTSDGESVIAWHRPPADGHPVVLYFHGNGGALNLRAERFRNLTADGTGLVALSYRGYGGSSGKPTETGLLADAAAAYAFAAGRYGPDRVVVWGESLGTGVAVALAADNKVARVILESPFTSAADIAAATYFFLPVRLLMHDQFRSDERIGRVAAPVLVLHGDRDTVVPFRYGERLYALIRAPKKFVKLAGAGHNDHDSFGAIALVRPFIEGTEVPPAGKE